MKTLLKTSPAAALASLLLLSAAPSALAQKYWNANDGEWNDASSWQGGTLPTGQTAFVTHDQSTNSTVNLTVSGTHSINQLFINSGKTVNLTFEDGASLSTTNTSEGWWLNTTYHSNPDPAASHLTFTGPETGTATIALHSIQLGRANTAAAGSSVTFEGPGLVVTSAGGGSATYVGPGSNDNLLMIRNGADVSLHGLWIGRSATSGQAYRDNRTIVDNASLTINGSSGNRELRIGSLISGTGSQDYENGMQNNSLAITNNASVTMASSGATHVGVADNAHSNFLSIDNNSQLLIHSSAMTVGKAGTNRGGNTVRIGSGSALKTGGAITINDYNTTGQNDGRNKLVIESGGTLTSSNTITIHGGLLRLEEGGSMEGKTVAGGAAALTLNIENDGLFEAEGDGLGSAVNTTINGGTLAVGMEEHTTAASLTLQSTVTFATAPGTLSLSLFDNGTADSIHLTSTGQLTLNNTALALTFKGTAPQFGDAWTLFTGATENIAGAFDLSLLPTLEGDLEWDISAFNTEGQWRIAVIPEPGTIGMAALGFFLLLGAAKRRLNTTSA